MRIKGNLFAFALAASITIATLSGSVTAVHAQNQSTVSAVTLQVVPGPQGQSVLTPRGMVVPLPGAGVNGNAVQIFLGAQGGILVR